jgi:hypothetical protein
VEQDPSATNVKIRVSELAVRGKTLRGDTQMTVSGS